MPSALRFTNTPFPAYAHRLGVTPHPLTDPRGHSHAARAHVPHAPPEQPAAAFDPGRWPDCKPYLYGIDLHNHGYWWEAHEEWESVWRASPSGSPHARLLQALIQSCAIWLKLETGERGGVHRLLSRAESLLANVNPDAPILGLRIRLWWPAACLEAEQCLNAKPGEERPAHPPMLHPTQ